MNMRDFLYHRAHSYPAGVAELERRLVTQKCYIENAISPGLAETHHMNAKVMEQMLDYVPNGNMEAAKFFATKAHATVIPIPASADHPCDMELLDGFMCVVKELGEFSAEFQQAWADGRITTKEFERLKLQWHEMVGAGQMFMERVGSMVEEPKHKLKAVK